MLLAFLLAASLFAFYVVIVSILLSMVGFIILKVQEIIEDRISDREYRESHKCEFCYYNRNGKCIVNEEVCKSNYQAFWISKEEQ